MNLNFITEVWETISQYMNQQDRDDAAESLVNLLVDNDFQAEDIVDAFRGHREVLTALKDYNASIEIEEEYVDYDDDDYDE